MFPLRQELLKLLMSYLDNLTEIFCNIWILLHCKRTRWYNMHMKWSCWSSNSLKKMSDNEKLSYWLAWFRSNLHLKKKKPYSFVENKEVFQLTCTCNNSCQYWNSKWRHTTHILPTAWSEYKLSSNNLCKLRHRPSGRVGENWLYDKSLCQCL